MDTNTNGSPYVKGYSDNPTYPVSQAPARVPFRQAFRDAVWAARGLGSNAKIVLLRIACFVDDHGRGCSISYKQLARDCGISEKTAKTVVAKLANWLDVHTSAGFYHKGRGRENLYNVSIPAGYGVQNLHPETGEIFHNAPFGVAQLHTYTATDNQSKDLSSRAPYGSNRRGGVGADTTSKVVQFPNWASQLAGAAQ